MNVYDFDGTIYYTNSTVDFAIWCMIRHPKLLFTYAPKTAVYGLLYIAGKIPEMNQDQKELVMFEVQNSLKHEEYADDIAKDHMERLLLRLQAFKSA